MTNVIDSSISNRDYIVVIDKSGSMTSRDCPGNKTRWEFCQESVQALVEKVCALDPDGIDLFFFNSKFSQHGNVTGQTLADAFKANSPQGSTMFAPVLNAAFNMHFSKAQRSTTIIIITDGEAGDATDTVKSIVDAANKIEADSELAITFIQIGKDVSAKLFLKKLDDDLQGAGAKFDIVDAKTMDDLETMPFEEILFDAIND